jgi:DNA repair exonuclease SbcCD nuclease subunit
MSKIPLFAATSDWHLEHGAWKRANTPKGDSFCSLRQIGSYCREHQVELLGAGDLFDELKPDTAIIERAFRVMDDMRYAERQVLFTQGQHEKAQPAYLSLHPYPQHVSGKLLHPRGVTVYGMDHVPADQLQAEIERVPRGVDIVICHQVWSDFMGVGAEGALEALVTQSEAKIILTGDFHEHTMIRFGETRVLSPGSICQQSIDESTAKSFFVVYDDFSIESIPLHTRPFFSYILQTEGDIQVLLSDIQQGRLCKRHEIPEAVQKPTLYVQCGRVEEAYKRITRAVGDQAFLFWKSLIGDSGTNVYSDEEAARAIPQGLEGCLDLVTQRGGPVYNSVLRLLRARDKKQELTAMCTEFGRSS